MAECRNCGVPLGFFGGNNGFCQDCHLKSLKAERTGDPNVMNEGLEERQEQSAEVEAILLTTETYPEGLSITKRIEVVTAECAFGMNIFKDLFAGVRNVVGGRSEAVQKTLRDTRRTALYELKKEAYEVGANAVVGIDLDYVELSAAGNMVLLVASGTAVRIEE